MKYKCKSTGGTFYKDKRVNFQKGENDVPDGALDHVGGCKMITQSTTTVVTDSQKRDKPTGGTKKEIKKWLDDNGVDYDPQALKDELIKILKDA